MSYAIQYIVLFRRFSSCLNYSDTILTQDKRKIFNLYLFSVMLQRLFSYSFGAEGGNRKHQYLLG